MVKISLPMFSCDVAIVTGHQMERTLSPGTSFRTWCNIQLRIRYSGVNPTVSSALSHVKTLFSPGHLDYLGTKNDARVSTLKRKRFIG